MERGEATPATWVLLTRGATRNLLGVSLAGTTLIVSAGGVRWAGAWIFLGSLFVVQLVNVTVLANVNPAVLTERLSRETPRERWDLIIFTMLSVLAFAVVLAAGLDRRFGWAPPLPTWSRVAAALLIVLGDAVFLWAVALNRYFSKFVRVRADQRVVSTGPYRWVRHPGYLGWLCFWLGLVMLLGSPLALALAGVSVPLVAGRAVLEERVLRDELDSYTSYAGRVRHRLIPLVW